MEKFIELWAAGCRTLPDVTRNLSIEFWSELGQAMCWTHFSKCRVRSASGWNAQTHQSVQDSYILWCISSSRSSGLFSKLPNPPDLLTRNTRKEFFKVDPQTKNWVNWSSLSSLVSLRKFHLTRWTAGWRLTMKAPDGPPFIREETRSFKEKWHVLQFSPRD
jgi:hypothetical protein